MIGEGYAVPLADGVTLTGATYDIDDPEPAVQTAGHIENLQRLAQMLPALASDLATQDAAVARWARRVSLRDERSLADDRRARRRSRRHPRRASVCAAHGRSICRARTACTAHLHTARAVSSGPRSAPN